MKKKILFVCSGNYYRSRFAEIYFNHHAKNTALGWEAFSRGFTAKTSGNKGPISEYALKALEEQSLAVDTTRFPKHLYEEDLKQADRIIALKEAEHRKMAQKDFPEWEEKIEFWGIHDIDVDSPDKALPELQEKLDLLLASLKD